MFTIFFTSCPEAFGVETPRFPHLVANFRLKSTQKLRTMPPCFLLGCYFWMHQGDFREA